MNKWKKIVVAVCVVCIIVMIGNMLSALGTKFTKLPDEEVPLGDTPYDDSFLEDMAEYSLWESGEYNKNTGEKITNRRRMRTPDPIPRRYIEYNIGLSEDIRLIFCEYDAGMNYLGCSTLEDGDVFAPFEDTSYFTITIYRTYSEKSLSPGQWNALFNNGLIVSVNHGEEELIADEVYQGSAEDVFLLDMSFYPMWESGDYEQTGGTPSTNKRRMRYPDYVQREHEDYLVDLSDGLNLIFFEYDAAMNYLGCKTHTNGDVFVPEQDTAWFTVSLHRNYSEKSMSVGQWYALFTGGLRIRISHGDTSIFELEKDKVLCTTAQGPASGYELAYALLDEESEVLADGLWNNLILNEVYQLTGHDLDNGNLTIYISSSEGSDDNNGLSPLSPKATFEEYSGMSNINILLKCGDVFNVSEGFQAGSNCVYAAYGEGERPVLNFYRELAVPFEEVEGYDNVWVADLSTLDICNNAASKSNCNIGQLLIDGEVNWKRKVWSTSDTFDPMSLCNAADGSWAADWHTNQLFLYSEWDPNYSLISYAPPCHAISMNKVSNVTFMGIEIVGAGMHGISMKNVKDINILGCYIHHIGGSILTSAGVRYGNAVQLWDSGTDVTVTHNFADWIFDTCYTNQGTSASSDESNIIFKNNIGAHAFWGLESWGDGYSSYSFSNIEYAYNVIYAMMDITNPDMPMYSSKSGRVIFADPTLKKEDYVSYRCGYTYNQMSSVNVSNSGTGEPTQIHNNIFWNTNRFLALIANDRSEPIFSCLYDNLFYGETDVDAPALFRYTLNGGTKNYLESPDGYIDASNQISIWPGGELGDNSAETEQLINLMEIISGTISPED